MKNGFDVCTVPPWIPRQQPIYQRSRKIFWKKHILPLLDLLIYKLGYNSCFISKWVTNPLYLTVSVVSSRFFLKGVLFKQACVNQLRTFHRPGLRSIKDAFHTWLLSVRSVQFSGHKCNDGKAVKIGIRLALCVLPVTKRTLDGITCKELSLCEKWKKTTHKSWLTC